jgi:3D (Asp-Asp-Asp) domain-containing protein
MTVTSYRSVPSQTDNSPYITSIGEKVNKSGVAASQDLLKQGTLKYGDIIYVEGYGLKVVNDTMNPRMTNHIDMWVKTRAEEKKVGTRTLKVYKIKGARYEEAH